jgi:DNA-binding PadR family transcriptional regulator
MDMTPTEPDSRFLYSGILGLHVLHLAARDGVFGSAMIEELALHGFRLSAGTLYPILHKLERRGLVVSRLQPVGRSRRRIYRATAKGRRALTAAKTQVHELFHMLVEESPAPRM